MNPFQIDWVDKVYGAGQVPPEQLLSLTVEESHRQRVLWVYFQHGTFAVGDICQLELSPGLTEPLVLPVWSRNAAGSNIGFAMNPNTNNTVVPDAMTLFWNNTNAAGYQAIFPFALPQIPCNKIILRLKSQVAAPTVQALLACLSLPS